MQQAPSFSDEEEEEEEEAAPSTVLAAASSAGSGGAAGGKKKKTAKQIAKDREAKERAEAEALSPEDKISEKMRLQKLVEQEDNKLTDELFDVPKDKKAGKAAPATAADSLATIPLSKKADAEALAKTVGARFKGIKKPNNVVEFINALIKEMAPVLLAEDLKNIDKVLTTAKTQAVKKERAQAAKKKKKGAIKMTNDDNYADLALDHAGGAPGEYYDEYDDADDFM